jgi:hypothetical protein
LESVFEEGQKVMAKGSGQAKQVFNTSTQDANTFQNQGQSTYNAMFPTLQQNATNPQGYSQGDLAKMNTANSQSAGGATAGLTGEANLMAGRTRNPGSMGAGLAEAARTSGRNENQTALKIQEANANLAQQKQQAALGQLGNLYGQNVSGLNDMLGNANKAVGEITAADQAVAGDILGGVKTAAGLGMGAAGMAGMGPGGGMGAMNFGASAMS